MVGVEPAVLMSSRNFLPERLQTGAWRGTTVMSILPQEADPRNCVRKTEWLSFQLDGRTPYLTKGEAVVAATAFRATGRKSLPGK